MSAVTVDVLTHTAHEAGLEGGTLQPLVNGACSFSSLTFKTTSYNLKGKPIHLMASLLVREGERLCVGASLLSPPLLVDARKRQPKEDKSGKAESESGGQSKGSGKVTAPATSPSAAPCPPVCHYLSPPPPVPGFALGRPRSPSPLRAGAPGRNLAVCARAARAQAREGRVHGAARD